MVGERNVLIIKFLVGLIIIVLVLVLFSWLKSSYHPGTTVFSLSRLLTRENTDFNTRNYDRLDTEHFRIKYTEVNQLNAPIVAEAAEEIYEPVTRLFNCEPPTPTLVVIYPNAASLLKALVGIG